MNFEGIGISPCVITHKTDKKFEEIPIYISGRDLRKKVKHVIDNVEVDEDSDEIVEHMPYQDSKRGDTRQILYISGKSGSGKSFYTSLYLKRYSKMFPKNPIYVFSSLLEDKVIDECKNVVRINFKDEKFYKADYTDIQKFKDSLVLYDDTDMIADPFIQTKIKDLQNLILTTGRHAGVFCIITSHKCCAGIRTALILAESQSITLFGDSMGYNTMLYALQSGFGFTKKQVDEIRALDTRYVTVLRTAPICVMHEKGIFTFGK
jgi:hypothetical protein